MESPPSRLAQAGAWYVQAVDALPPDGWRQPSLCANWSAANVVAHVATGDQLVRKLTFEATGKDWVAADLPADFAERQKRAAAMAEWEPARLHEAARMESEQTVAALGEAVKQAPQAVVTMSFGPAPLTVVRGMRVNEYVIHGHDLMPAIGRSIPIPDWFIDQALGDSLTVMTRMHQRSSHKGKTASFHLHRTDGDGEWVLLAESGQARVEPGHARADVAMRGPAEGLYWVLMGRGKPEEHGVDVHGDLALAAAFKEWFPGP